VTSTDTAALAIVEEVERALALELLGFPAVIEEVATTLEFHKLTCYLQALAGAYTSFHERCPVLRASVEVRASRLALCDVTARVIAQGLDLLGIAAPERM
jgi:arginyl-tRNA synthetase